MLERLGGRSAASDVFMATLLGIGGLVAAGYAIGAALRMRSEESSLRLEQVLAAPVERPRWLASHLVFALLGPAVALARGRPHDRAAVRRPDRDSARCRGPWPAPSCSSRPSGCSPP